MELEILPYALTVCKLGTLDRTVLSKEFLFIGKTDEELSLVCRTEDVPSETLEREDGWRGLRVKGILDFSMVGVLSELTSILAEAGVGIFAVSTYNTDYILFKEKDYKRAISALGGSGHTIVLKRVTMRACSTNSRTGRTADRRRMRRTKYV